MVPPFRIAMIGYQFMGKAYSPAVHDVAAFFPDLPARPVKQVLCGRDASELARVADRWGWAAHTTDWRETVHRGDVDAIIVGVPNHLHRDMCMEAFSAGKHVLCEKPVALDGRQAEQMAKGRGARGGVPRRRVQLSARAGRRLRAADRSGRPPGLFADGMPRFKMAGFVP